MQRLLVRMCVVVSLTMALASAVGADVAAKPTVAESPIRVLFLGDSGHHQPA